MMSASEQNDPVPGRRRSRQQPCRRDSKLGRTAARHAIFALAMERELDYSQHTEAELAEMFGRMDPRYAPLECARLGKHLTEQGYLVTQGDTGPGSVTPSPQKVQALIGSPRPFECDVEFGKEPRFYGYRDPDEDGYGFIGAGRLRADGICVCLSGRNGDGPNILPSLLQQDQVEIPTRRIVNVESCRRLVRFEYTSAEADPEVMILRLADEATASALVSVLPKARTRDFRQQIQDVTEFEAELVERSAYVPVTSGLIAINFLVFFGALYVSADPLRPSSAVLLTWGSNFGPGTSDGQWWRLLTSVFLHFGWPHVVANMVALSQFGPLVERLYGSVTYTLLYLLSGVLGNLVGIAWHPAGNSAGASGAVFGVCGALLAALLRSRDRFPTDMQRPTQNSTLLFVAWALYTSFSSPGIDYAAHIGGLAAGFALGWAAALMPWPAPHRDGHSQGG